MLSTDFKLTIGNFTKKPARWLHHGLGSSPARSSEIDSPRTASPDFSGDVAFVPHPDADNPVLTGADVYDYGDVNFVADPFIHPGPDGDWHMFMEVFNDGADPTAAIGHAHSVDGLEWEYTGIVLDTGTHAAFPFVFEHDGAFFMLPDQMLAPGDATLTLYRAMDFPAKWEPVATLVEPGRRTSDATVFHLDGRWWLMAGHHDSGSTYLYHSRDLLAENWTAHRDNPVVSGDRARSRPGGRPILTPDGVIVFFQDCGPEYGHQVRMSLLTDLTTSTASFEEHPASPILAGTGGLGWNSGRMHHVDPHVASEGWICAVDGDIGFGRGTWTTDQWSIGIYTGVERQGLLRADGSDGP